MSSNPVYSFLVKQLKEHLDPQVTEATRERLALLVLGIIKAKSASPARIAHALALLGLVSAMIESVERRIRRIENDPQLTASLCFHPLAKQYLAMGKPRQLLLLLDPTCQEDRLVMLTVAVWYRGRSLPLAWMLWKGNTPLVGAGFWERVETLLEQVAPLLPRGVPVVWLADRAFGTPQFLDKVTARGWHAIVRLQEQTRCRNQHLPEQPLRALLGGKGQRRKLRCEVFKKQGWRRLSVVSHWGKRHKTALHLASTLPLGWHLLALYRRRYGIEALFRDYKSGGWEWEKGQVTDLAHLERLLVGMALAAWLVVMAGAHVAAEILREPPSGRRRTRSFVGKYSLFQLGLDYVERLLWQFLPFYVPCQLPDWDAPNWSTQCLARQVKAYIFAGGGRPAKKSQPPVRP